VVLSRANQVTPDGNVLHQRMAKLSGKEPRCMVWGEEKMLIGATRENCIRVYDMERDEYYILSLNKQKGQFSPSDIIFAVAYDPQSKLVAGASRNGFLYMWRMKGDDGGMRLESEERWSFVSPPTELSGELNQLVWGYAQGRSVLAVQGDEGVSVLSEHMMRKSFGKGTAAVQVCRHITASGVEWCLGVFRQSCH